MRSAANSRVRAAYIRSLRFVKIQLDECRSFGDFKFSKNYWHTWMRGRSSLLRDIYAVSYERGFRLMDMEDFLCARAESKFINSLLIDGGAI